MKGIVKEATKRFNLIGAGLLVGCAAALWYGVVMLGIVLAWLSGITFGAGIILGLITKMGTFEGALIEQILGVGVKSNGKGDDDRR